MDIVVRRRRVRGWCQENILYVQVHPTKGGKVEENMSCLAAHNKKFKKHLNLANCS